MILRDKTCRVPMGKSDGGRGGPLYVSRRRGSFQDRDFGNFQRRGSVDVASSVVIDVRFGVEAKVFVVRG